MTATALAGTRVLDLSSFLAGPSCAQLLSDFGAEVIKVENRSGDEMRQWSPIIDGESVTFKAANRGKKSITLNLKSEAGRRVLYDLVRESDVVVHNFLPDVARRLKVDWDAIKQCNPRIILCSISGYGSRGPLANKPGFDLMVQAFSGLMSVTGDSDGPPMRVGVSTLDITTGVFAFAGINAALLARAEGRCDSQHVEVSLLATSVHLLNYHITSYLNAGVTPKRSGSGVGHIVPYQSFEADDGYVLVGATNTDVWQRLCGVLGVPELASDPRFATGPDRVANKDALIGLIEPRFRGRTVADWVSRFERERIPCSPVQTVEQMVRDPQIAAMNLLLPEDGHGGNCMTLLGIPIEMTGTPAAAGPRPPRLGADTEALLRERLGLDEAALDRLRQEEAI